MEREADIQDNLKDAIESVAREYRFEGIEITRVKRDHPVDKRVVDLAVFIGPETYFLFIETKKKTPSKIGRFFDPIDISAIGQVMSYAAILKRSTGILVPFVGTANPEMIAVFRTPEDIEKYVNWDAVRKRNYDLVLDRLKYRLILEKSLLWYEKLKLDKEYIYSLLSQLVQEYLKKKIIREEPTKALIARLREFVNWVAGRISPRLELEILREPLKSQLERLGYKLERKNIPQVVSNLAKMMAYIFMNKIIFYKLLERVYHLPYLRSFDTSSLARFKEDINYYFTTVIEKTRDFEPIFITGLYDKIPIPDDPELMDYINDFVMTLDSIDLVKMSEQIGYIYEELIPPEERHQFGQFYTPPWVCELITKWCIRSPDDLVFDPGVGSGGFLLKVYDKLLKQKGFSGVTAPPHVHEKILEQLFAVDINPFAAHLSAMGISTKNVRTPSTKMNIISADFFSLQPQQQVFVPYVVKTPVGEIQRSFTIPKMDAVVGNPPYTRWTEIPEETQKLIKKRLGKLMKKYGLTPQVSRGVEPGIYTYWIIHATDFLKQGGRLGMIISNTWLQTDYGIGFARFLLDHYKIKAIIDFALRLFKDALISNCILLAEKESDERKRLENEVVFIHIPGEVEKGDVDELLKAVEMGKSEKYAVTLVKQKDLPRDRKWINVFFKSGDISEHPLMSKLDELFEPLRGNTVWAKWALSHGRRPDPGSSEFHYLSPSKVRAHGLDQWAYPQAPLSEALVYPAITRAEQANFFTFTEHDWEEMRRSDDRCYMFVCHMPRERLPDKVKDYIEWGERECRTKIRGTRKGGRLASETEAAKVRARETRWFHGWYDLGGVIPAPIFAIRRAWLKTRFIWCKFPIALHDNEIALIPLDGIVINELQLKALLAYLNSSLTQYYIETHGIKSGGGVIGCDPGTARRIPILDVRKLDQSQLQTLAQLFDQLELKARQIGGASTKDQIQQLKPQIYAIDSELAKLLNIPQDQLQQIQQQVDQLIQRRISGAKKSRPEAIRGETKPKENPN